MPPGITPLRTISIARCSNRRISRTVRYRSAESAMTASPGRSGRHYDAAITTPPLRRRHPVADGGQDAVPQAGAGREGEGDRSGALRPLGLVFAAEVSEHLHCHRRVLLAVDLDVASQVVNERVERSEALVDADDLLEHVRDQVLAAEGERRGLHVDGRALDQAPGEPDELGGRRRHAGLVERFEHGLPGAELVDEGIDDRRVGAGLGHAVDVELEMTDEAAAELVALLDENDVVDEAAAAGRAGGHPRQLDAGEVAL